MLAGAKGVFDLKSQRTQSERDSCKNARSIESANLRVGFPVGEGLQCELHFAFPSVARMASRKARHLFPTKHSFRAASRRLRHDTAKVEGEDAFFQCHPRLTPGYPSP